MRRTTSAGALLFALLAAPVLALAQGPVLSFDQLNTRLRLGDTVYVTDEQGREITGKIQSLAVRNGALIGVAAGVGLAAAHGHAYCSSHDCEAEAPSRR